MIFKRRLMFVFVLGDLEHQVLYFGWEEINERLPSLPVDFNQRSISVDFNQFLNV